MTCREVLISVVHMLTNESQEVRKVGMIQPRIVSVNGPTVPKMSMTLVPIPHCGQLKNTTRILSTPP